MGLPYIEFWFVYVLAGMLLKPSRVCHAGGHHVLSKFLSESQVRVRSQIDKLRFLGYCMMNFSLFMFMFMVCLFFTSWWECFEVFRRLISWSAKCFGQVDIKNSN